MITSLKRVLYTALSLIAGTAMSFGNPAEGGSTQLLSVTSLDLVIIVLYFVTVLGIGFYLKKYTKTGDDFFMAGRKITAWIA